MPAPVYVNNAGTWRQQRGTSFGTDEEGKDFIEIVYRGSTAGAVAWRAFWTAGTACPEPGFTHCKLLHPPTVREDSPGFSTASLRFEGLSPLSGTTTEGTDATITHQTEEQEFSVYHKSKDGANGNAIYLYNRVVVQAKYIRATQPTENLRYASKLNDDPDPKPIANGEKNEIWFKDYSLLVEDSHYKVASVGRILDWSQTGADVYEVTEEHTKYLVGLIVDVG
jgi:hypothetical protein